MCSSGVMFPSEVMCASRVRMRNTSHHFATKGSKTSLWRSHNITAACRNITLYKRSKLCYNIYRRRGAIMAESKLRELSMEFSVDIIHLTNQGFSPFSRWHLFCQHVPKRETSPNGLVFLFGDALPLSDRARRKFLRNRRYVCADIVREQNMRTPNPVRGSSAARPSFRVAPPNKRALREQCFVIWKLF